MSVGEKHENVVGKRVRRRPVKPGRMSLGEGGEIGDGFAFIYAPEKFPG